MVGEPVCGLGQVDEAVLDRPLRWRTIRAMTTTRRPGDREARDSAARRPRPKVERPAEPPLRLNVWLRWPAFFAARITSPTKLLGRLAP